MSVHTTTWEAFGEEWRLVNPLNNRQGWRKVHGRGKAHHEAAFLLTQSHVQRRLSWATAEITIERIGKRPLDSDGLAASAKHIRDGIAHALGVDDGSDRYTWLYTQSQGKQFGVRVTLRLTRER